LVLPLKNFTQQFIHVLWKEINQQKEQKKNTSFLLAGAIHNQTGKIRGKKGWQKSRDTKHNNFCPAFGQRSATGSTSNYK
jgi:hypothetical protein